MGSRNCDRRDGRTASILAFSSSSSSSNSGTRRLLLRVQEVEQLVCILQTLGVELGQIFALCKRQEVVQVLGHGLRLGHSLAAIASEPFVPCLGLEAV